MTELTIKDITNLYLYKEKLIPENRLDDSIITKTIPKNPNVNKKDFMSGPGRFVKADDFDIVRLFFTAKDSLINLSSQALVD